MVRRPAYALVRAGAETHTLSMQKIARVTVTLPTELLAGIDRVESNRSRFVAEAVEHELALRRREALLESIANPHVETTEFIDEGTADWTRNLPEDHDLMNPAVGTAVRWVEGVGWTEDPD